MSLSQHWTGYFEQDGIRHPVVIVVAVTGNDFTGFGMDEIGRFRISGKRADKNVSFMKNYGGLISVEYSGTIDKNIITGGWTLGNTKGSFQLDTSVTQYFYGHFEQNGTRNDMLLSLAVRDGRIMGNGLDKIGKFSVDGTFGNGECKFRKNYEDLISVDYRGTIEGNRVIGFWVLQGNDKGTFELGYCLDTTKQTPFTGYFEQDGKKNPMELDLLLDGETLGGTGHDRIGCFSINGTIKDGRVRFTKRYGGLVEVHYEGKEDKRTINGNWKLGNSEGTFQLMH